VARLGAQFNIFPRYEVENGDRYIISGERKGTRVSEFLKPQGRFSFLCEEERERIRENVDRKWERLMRRLEVG